MNGQEKFRHYVDIFNANDKETVKQYVDNDSAYDFLVERIPLLHCPDKAIEETYYFRFWTLRKHIKLTEDCGFVFTEFLSPVPWGGKYNTINAGVGHHIDEARWLADGEKYIQTYAAHFLDGKRNAHQYSAWLISALYECCRMKGDFSFMLDRFDQLAAYYAKWEELKGTKSGLYWTIDNFDAMEYSISGTTGDFERQPGLRPLLNSYMYKGALVLAELSGMKGEREKQTAYKAKADSLREKIETRLWDGDFYKAVHASDIETVYDTKDIVPDQNARELIGYVPFIFGLGNEERAKKMFPLLLDKNVFLAEMGLATADKGHARYLYDAPHECLWNGYVWPFATSQTLDACIHVMNRYGESIMRDEDFVMLLSQYARMHHRVDEDGKTVNWIDEMMHPDKLVWSTREYLHGEKYEPKYGDPDRGKDYNHSTFCDLVIRGLVGVDVEGGQITLHPHIPSSWDYLKLENLTVGGKRYDIIYDKSGEMYGLGKGWQIHEK